MCMIEKSKIRKTKRRKESEIRTRGENACDMREQCWKGQGKGQGGVCLEVPEFLERLASLENGLGL